MHQRMLAGLAAGVLLVAAGCGDDEEKEGFTADEQRAVDVLTATMEGDKPLDHEKEQWRCTAEGIVDRLGVPALKRAGLITEDFTSRLNQVRVDLTTATAIGDAYLVCHDISAVVELGKERESRVPEQAWDEFGACYEKHRDKLRASVIEANTVNAGRKAQKAWVKALETCNKIISSQIR